MTEFHSVRAFAREEPRIELIESTLRALLRLVELECGGEPVRVDGFRLRNLEDWRTVRETSLQLNLGSLSTACNCRCDFCYEEGNPRGLFEKEPRFVSMEEAVTRQKYLHDGRGLPRESKGFFEPLTNPAFLDLMRLVREGDPDHLIDVTTNGAGLSEELIADLAALEPIYVNVSVISADAAVRGRIMGGGRSDGVISALEALRAHEIPFMGSVVPWPEQGLEDLTRTLEILDRQEARIIRVSMPALTRHHPRYEPGLLQEWVPAVKERVEEVRRRIQTPVLVSPFTHVTSSLDPIVEGVIRKSPAEAAGLQVGDRLLSIDGRRIVSRAHASSLLDRALAQGTASLEFERDEQIQQVTLAEPPAGLDLYPYQPRGYARLDFPGMRFGLCLPGSFHLSYVKRVHEAIEARRASHVVVLASPFFREQVAGLLADLPSAAEKRLEVLAPENRYFGGDVSIGDLWVLEDISRSVREYAGSGGRPDLLVMPNSFLSRWGRDLLGVPYTELETALGVEVAVIPCERILL